MKVIQPYYSLNSAKTKRVSREKQRPVLCRFYRERVSASLFLLYGEVIKTLDFFFVFYPIFDGVLVTIYPTHCF